MTDVYPAREAPIAGVTGKLIVDALSDRGRLVAWTPTVEQGVAYLSARPGRATWCSSRARGMSIAPSGSCAGGLG